MNIKVENNVPNIKVTVNKNENGEITILLAEESKKIKLGEVECGKVVKIGEREFIVLGHSADTTAVLVKDSVKEMRFGGAGYWRDSLVRRYCNNVFLNELACAIGERNIVKHTVRMIADDGTGKGQVCEDKISLLTTDLFRRYREYIPFSDECWWTATRVTYNKGTGINTYMVKYVNYGGILNWAGDGSSLGVHPYCILKSSVLVEC